MTTPSHPDWASPTYDPPLPDSYGEPAGRPLPPSFAGIQPEPYATLATPPVTHAHGQHTEHEHTAQDYAAHQQPIDNERVAPQVGESPYRVGPWPVAADDKPAGNVAGPPAAEQPVSDTAEVLGQRDVITLVSGTQVRVRKLRTFELMALMDIVLGGFAGKLNQLNLNPDEPSDVFLAKFGALLLTAFPGARRQTMAFLREVCDPAGLVEVGARELGSKAVRDRNEALKADLDAELANADFDDTLSIIEKTIELNAEDFKRWGKRLAGMWSLLTRAGRIPASPSSPA